METERRVFAVEGLRVETREDGTAPKILGHAAVFNALSEDMGGWREQVAPGAFTEALTRDDVRALFNHDSNYILGRNRSKTLRLAEDATGLAIEIDAPDTPTIRDLVLEPIRRGDVSQMSFAFSVRPNGQDWAQDDEGRTIRTLTNVRLYDVSPVVYPAYPQTDVAVRELRCWQDQLKRALATPHLLRARELQALT